MMNEPASGADDTPSLDETLFADPMQESDVAQRVRLREIISDYMTIADEYATAEDDLPTEDRSILAQSDSYLVRSYEGHLRGDTQQVHDELDQRLAEYELFPLLRVNMDENAKAPHVVHLAGGRLPDVEPSNVWINIVLLVLTIISVLLTGTQVALSHDAYAASQSAVETSSPAETGETQDAQQAQSGDAVAAEDDAANGGFVEALLGLFANLYKGIPYAAAIMLILGPHEMGHYLMMRRHGTAATLPYFIPAPLISPFGTFGAAISLQEPLRNRRHLLDVGAAGPIAGFVFAVPILLIGLATSPTLPVSTSGAVEGNSLLYAGAKILVFGEFLPNGEIDVFLNQLAWAGWTGLFVTALNLIPLGQLDGGHVLYSLFGDHARKLYIPLIGVSIFMVLFVSSAWMIFVVLLLFVGRFYAVPLDNVTSLGATRRWVGIASLAIFVLTFTPDPLRIAGQSGGLLTGMIGVVVSLLVVRRALHVWQFKFTNREEI